jgi:hypothetical protein
VKNWRPEYPRYAASSLHAVTNVLTTKSLRGTRAMTTDPRDLSALEKAVNDASGKAATLWISFVTSATVLAITTGTVSHKMLLLEEPVQLPLLNVKLPLLAYFYATPLFFLVYQFYVMLQLDGLAAT